MASSLIAMASNLMASVDLTLRPSTPCLASLSAAQETCRPNTERTPREPARRGASMLPCWRLRMRPGFRPGWLIGLGTKIGQHINSLANGEPTYFTSSSSSSHSSSTAAEKPRTTQSTALQLCAVLKASSGGHIWDGFARRTHLRTCFPTSLTDL